MKVTNSIKQKWAEMLMGDFSPHGIALGLAVGTFIALLPSFGFSALLALGFIFIFPKINRPTVFIAIMIWNPVVQIPIYAISYQLGSILFEGMTVIEYNFEVLNQIYSFTRRFLVAHLIVSTVITVATYLLSLAYLQFKFRN